MATWRLWLVYNLITMDEFIQHILENGEKVNLTNEPVYAGVRELTNSYSLDGEVVIETITYRNAKESDGWSLIQSITYELQQQNGFETIEI